MKDFAGLLRITEEHVVLTTTNDLKQQLQTSQ